MILRTESCGFFQYFLRIKSFEFQEEINSLRRQVRELELQTKKEKAVSEKVIHLPLFL